jgi:hypothetical protein
VAREQFIDNLRFASRMLPPPRVDSDLGAQTSAYLAAKLYAADLWLTPKVVEGFDPADFADWPKKEREELAREVAAFREIARRVPPNKPASKSQSAQARKHLERAIKIMRNRLLPEWIEAQNEMMQEARTAAAGEGWFAQMDEKEVSESLLGSYRAPRLRIRTPDREVVLDPVARFGSGRQGVVDLVVMPTYETAYLVAFKDGQWQILSVRGTARSKPFTHETLVNTIAKLPRF